MSNLSWGFWLVGGVVLALLPSLLIRQLPISKRKSWIWVYCSALILVMLGYLIRS